MNNLTPELYWLTLTTLFTGTLWVPYVIDRLIVRKPLPALMDTKPETGFPSSAWAQRLIKAHANAVENLIIFAIAVLTLHVAGLSTPLTQAAAAFYLIARIVHVLAYVFAIPLVRTLAFASGWAVQVILLLTLLGCL